jgi:hypothetical protein
MVEPPSVFDPLVQQWRCEHCGCCCDSGWRIDLRPEELRAMADKCFASGADADALRLLDEHRAGRRIEGLCAVPRSPLGACWFRREARCSYRLKHGGDTLPVACMKFPYLGLLTPTRRLLGTSFACPAALALLARQADVAPADAAAPPPHPVVCYDFRGSESDGSAELAREFWAIHWDWWELVRASTGPAAERLATLARRASGVELPRVGVDARFWTSPALCDEFAAELLERGAERAVLAGLFPSPVPLQPPLGWPEPADEEALLNRYLQHRLLLPEFMLKGASLGRLLGVMFALVARFRMARARGMAALDAIRHVDQLALHSDFTNQLFPPEVPEDRAWPSLGMVALASSSPERA